MYLAIIERDIQLLRSHEVVVDKRVDRKWEGKTADRMYDLFLFHAYEMLIFSI